MNKDIKAYKNIPLFFNPHNDIIINKTKDQVALVHPLLKSWIKISFNAYRILKKLSNLNINLLIESQQIKAYSKEEFINLVKYLLNNEYLMILEDYNRLNEENIIDCYNEKMKSTLPEISKRLYLSLTSSCNLKCIHCYNTVNKPGKALSEENQAIYKILERLKGSNIKEIILTGGEPFLRKDIFNIVEKAKKITKEITINTNSLLLNGQIIQSLKKYDFLTVAVSLDGLTRQTHEGIRGENTFDNTITNIKLLIKNGIKTHIIATLTKRNYKELVGFDEFIEGLGASGNLSFFTPVGKGMESIESLIMDEDSIQEYRDLLFEKHKNKIPEKSNKNNTLPIKFNCSAGIGVLGIEHTGRVVPCHLFLGKDISLGNILDEPLSDMQQRWIGNKNLSVDNNNECQKCSIRHFCGNGCLANTYYSNGTFNSKDPNCIIHQSGIENRLWNCEN